MNLKHRPDTRVSGRCCWVGLARAWLVVAVTDSPLPLPTATRLCARQEPAAW